MKKITSRQSEVLQFLKDFKERWTYMPTTRDIADHFKINQTAAQNLLNRLQTKGYITRKPNKARAIVINYGQQ